MSLSNKFQALKARQLLFIDTQEHFYIVSPKKQVIIDTQLKCKEATNDY